MTTITREEWEKEARDAHRPSLPHQRREFGMYLFVASLSTFFIASLLAYGTIRVYFHNGANPLHLPVSVVFSTVTLLTGSHFLQRALKAVRNQSLKQFQISLAISLSLGSLFFILQSVAIVQLLFSHWASPAGEARPYGPGFYSHFVACTPLPRRLDFSNLRFNAGNERQV